VLASVDVAPHWGFSSHSPMASFRKLMGMTPSECQRARIRRHSNSLRDSSQE
jgi:AraC-like DNA-binding protein